MNGCADAATDVFAPLAADQYKVFLLETSFCCRIFMAKAI